MNFTKRKTKFIIRRCFARSRLEADYFVKSYEIVLPIYKRGLQQHGNPQKNDIDEVTAIYPEGIGA